MTQGVAGGIGAAAGSLLGYGNAAVGQAYQQQLNKTARRWSEMMSNTAWQRGVADMRAAGINPMLAFSQGGASAPQASGGSAPTPQVDLAGDFQRGVSSAQQLQVFSDTAGRVKAEREDAENRARISGVAADNASERIHQEIAAIIAGSLRDEQAGYESRARRELVDKQVEGQGIQNELSGWLVPGARAQGQLDQSEFGQTLRKVDRVMDSIGGAAGLGGRFLQGALSARRRGPTTRTETQQGFDAHGQPTSGYTRTTTEGGP